MSVVFDWNPEEFSALVNCCEWDDAVIETIPIIKKGRSILEAGCGTGRVVKYLSDKGYTIEGIEKNGSIVEQIRQKHNINIHQGDILNIPRPDNHYDYVLSYGTIEHFEEGPEKVMAEMKRVLKPDGILIVTVPSFNLFRQKRYTKGDGYYKFMANRTFYEYRFTPDEFRDICINAGFRIIRDIPISHMDGMFHEKLADVEFKNWMFYPSKSCLIINDEYKKIPFFHNHQHLAICQKPA